MTVEDKKTLLMSYDVHADKIKAVEDTNVNIEIRYGTGD